MAVPERFEPGVQNLRRGVQRTAQVESTTFLQDALWAWVWVGIHIVPWAILVCLVAFLAGHFRRF
ncbi:MAG TPA: hypothetical protein VGK74_02325 [Symbiobacteriaceae bacterium]